MPYSLKKICAKLFLSKRPQNFTDFGKNVTKKTKLYKMFVNFPSQPIRVSVLPY